METQQSETERHPVIKAAIKQAETAILESGNDILQEILNRHADGSDMTFSLKFKVAAKSPNKLEGRISFTTPYILDFESEIEDPNQLKMNMEGIG